MEALLGYPMSEYYVSRLLKAKGFSRRKMSKSIPPQAGAGQGCPVQEHREVEKRVQ